ncbi:hypothetical protein AC1031_015452 [Aphanomyces cochlioides]|nr:hypothetical protein AC1031_015452 [Aphanomyces cochlioides]
MAVSEATALMPQPGSQAHQNILYFGTLEKRRDGAVRGGWATRLFLLTPQWLVYFRVPTKFDLLGEERERVALSSITKVRVAPEEELSSGAVEVPREYCYIEIVLDTPGKTLLMRNPMRESHSSRMWVSVIENQRQLLLNPNAKTTKPPVAKLPSRTVTSPKPKTEAVNCSVAMVVMVDDYTEREEFVVAKKIAFGDQINLGVVRQGGACLIMLDDGGIARIGTQALMGSWDANETCWVECLGSTSMTEVEVSVTCQVVKQNPQPPMSPVARVSPDVSNGKEWIRKAEEGASLGFLLMAMLVHFMLGVQGFHWTHKACLTTGAALAISTLVNSSSSKSTRKPLRRMNSSLIPKVQLTMTIHRCRRQVSKNNASNNAV